MKSSNLIVLLAFCLTLVACVPVPVHTNNGVQGPRSPHDPAPSWINVDQKYVIFKSIRNRELLSDLVAPFPTVPHADIEELIQAVQAATVSIKAAVDGAIDEAKEILVDAPLVLQDLLNVVEQVEAVALYIVQSAIREIINNPDAELPTLVENVTTALEIILQSAAQEIRDTVSAGAPEVLPQVEALLDQVGAQIQAAIQPVLDIVAELDGGESSVKT